MFCWTLLLTGASQGRGYAAVAVEGKVYTFVGVCGGDMAEVDVNIFNTASLRWRKMGREALEVNFWHHRHTAVLVEDIIYIWGGSYSNMLYGFDVDTHRWFKPTISGTVPVVRFYHPACVLGKVMFIHGGWNQLTGPTNGFYKLDTITMVCSLINTRGTPPPVLSGHSATIIGTKMFVFGGKGGPWYKPKYYNNITVFDTETNCWLSTPSAQLLPEGCWGHSAFTYNGELYIFGGQGYQTCNDLWKFNPETFSWKKVDTKGNGPSQMSWACCCMVGDRIILFKDYLYILDLSPSLKTLCKLVVIQCGLEQSELPHNIRRELAAMTTNSNNRKE